MQERTFLSGTQDVCSECSERCDDDDVPVSQVPAPNRTPDRTDWLTSRREMTRRECVALLATGSVGRVVYLDGAIPEVVPVSYQVADESVVFGVEMSSPLAQQPEGTVVTFQADSFNTDYESGWHVRAIGVVGSILQPEEMAVAGSILPPQWPVGGHAVEVVIEIRFTLVGGHVVETCEPDKGSASGRTRLS